MLETSVSFIPFFVFGFLVTFGDEVMKIQKYYAIFIYGKKQKENYATKVSKIPKNKGRKYGRNKT